MSTNSVYLSLIGAFWKLRDSTHRHHNNEVDKPFTFQDPEYLPSAGLGCDYFSPDKMILLTKQPFIDKQFLLNNVS
ncbi:MAG: hypothetical protein ACI9ES_000624 [Oceanospirillaceae bacterium]|jgi:hypothetical protein